METLRTSKGHEVIVHMTDERAAGVIEGQHDPSKFAWDLAQAVWKKKLTVNQRPWLHKIANEYAGFDHKDEAAPATPARFRRVVEMLQEAKTHIRFPKIRVHMEAGSQVVFSLAGAQARVPGSVNVASEGGFGNATYYGRIRQDGTFEPRGILPTQVLGMLDVLAADADLFLAENGRHSGACCFCGRELTTTDSLEAGYGPICADHYGLPWGGKRAMAQEKTLETTPYIDPDDLPAAWREAEGEAREYVRRFGANPGTEEFDGEDRDPEFDSLEAIYAEQDYVAREMQHSTFERRLEFERDQEFAVRDARDARGW